MGSVGSFVHSSVLLRYPSVYFPGTTSEVSEDIPKTLLDPYPMGIVVRPDFSLMHTQDRWGYAALHVANAKGVHVVISTLCLLSRHELAEVSAMNNCCLTALVGIFH